MTLKRLDRPVKLNDERQEQILGGVRRGVCKYVVARAAGVPPAHLDAWIERGNSSRSGRYKQFVEQLELAEANGICDLHMHIAEAEDWRASALALEYLEDQNEQHDQEA